jgi:hypothetical protein
MILAKGTANIQLLPPAVDTGLSVARLGTRDSGSVPLPPPAGVGLANEALRLADLGWIVLNAGGWTK